MTIREMLEKWEEVHLSPYATLSMISGRYFKETVTESYIVNHSVG